MTSARAGMDRGLQVERARGEFDVSAGERSGYPDTMLLLAADGWAPTFAYADHRSGRVSVGYEDEEGREVIVVTRAAPDSGAPGSAGSGASGDDGPPRHDCVPDPGPVSCEEFGGDGDALALAGRITGGPHP